MSVRLCQRAALRYGTHAAHVLRTRCVRTRIDACSSWRRAAACRARAPTPTNIATIIVKTQLGGAELGLGLCHHTGSVIIL